MSAEGITRCQARHNGGSTQCERPPGHPGMHWADYRALRWGGRYTRSELSGKAGAVKDAEKDQAARRKKPRGERCEICCERAELKNGICADRIACLSRQPPLFGAEALDAAK